MGLTKKQKILLDFVDEFIRSHDYSPTFREIMRALGYKSVSTVAKHVDNLVVLGHLEKQDGRVRSITLANSDVGQPERPWWHKLEREIAARRSSTDDARLAEAEVLQQALEIVKE